MENTPNEDNYDNKYIHLENKEPFQVLVISPNRLDKDWMAPNYLKNILTDTFCKYESIDPIDYIAKIATYLEIQKYPYPDIKVNIIAEETDYIYEIMYIDIIPECKKIEILNDFGTMLNTNGDDIFGNVIVTKTKVDSRDNIKSNPNMFLVDVTIDTMEKMLYSRAHTTVVTYNSDDSDEPVETIVFGPLDKFASVFFEESQYTYKKLEFGFLKHNVNIWYSENKYGNLDVFGNLLPDLARVDKMIVFTMWTDNFRGNFTLDEFKKIKYLSKKLEKYMIPEDIDVEEKDHLNRVIMKTKYRILNTVYGNNI